MVITAHLLVLIVALICFAVSALWSPPKGDLVAAGLAFLTLAFIFA